MFPAKSKEELCKKNIHFGLWPCKRKCPGKILYLISFKVHLFQLLWGGELSVLVWVQVWGATHSVCAGPRTGKNGEGCVSGIIIVTVLQILHI